MADTNAQMEELARILEQVNAEMAAYGRITKQTADDKYDAEVKAKYGINNATKAMDKMGDAAGYVAGAAMSAGKAMLDGKKGAAAFNESIDDMTKAATAAAVALALMNPFGKVVGLLIAGVTAAVGAYAAYTKAANNMADQLYKTYSGLSKAGASASDGMTGVLKASNQLGLSMEEMEGFVGQITANSKDLALFSGSVFEGRQKLGDMGDALRGSRQDFLKMGMSMTDVSEGMLGYLKIQTRLGQSQNKTTAELADGAKKYLVEQDALAKLTGQNRKEMEDQRERALQGEQFAAKIRQLELEGNHKAAQELLKLNSIYEAAGPKMASAFQASVTGNLSNADAQEANLASNGAMLETTQKVIANQMSYAEAATQTGKAMGKTADTVGVVLGQFGAYNDSFGPINEQLKLAQLAQGDITAKMLKIKEDQDKMLQGRGDKMVDKQAELINTQISANEGMKNFIAEGIEPAQNAMIVLANASLAAAQALYRMVGGDHEAQTSAAKKNTDAMKQQGLVNQSTTNDAGMDFGQLSGADGGVFKGPKSGYPVLMHGTEAIIPMDKISGGNKLGGIDSLLKGNGTREQSSTVSDDHVASIDAMLNDAIITGEKNIKITEVSFNALISSLTKVTKNADTTSLDVLESFDDILADSKKIEKLTDADTKRAEKYNLAYKSYIDLKTQLMELETPSLKEQIDIIQKQALTVGGQPAANTGSQTRSAPSGTGLKLPAMSNMPSMGGGQGMPGGIASQNDLTKLGLKLKTGDVQAEGGKIDPKIIDMAQQVQANMPNFGYFSGFNDKFHQEKSPSSSHTTGRAMDFTLSQAPSIEEGQEIVKWLKSMGASVAIDEYNNPSSKATAGHIHAQIAGYADGGVATTPQIAMVAEKGPEAMIPLDNGNIPIKLEMPDVKAMFDGMAKAFTDQADKGTTMSSGMSTTEIVDELKASRQQNFELLSLIQEMVKSQKDSTSIQERILQTSM